MEKFAKDKQIEIVINDKTKEYLFKASDIGKIIGMTNIRVLIKDFDITEKVAHIMDTNGGPQKVNFLTKKGLKKVICNSRKPNAIDIAKELNIEINDIFYIPFETSLIKFIKEVYKNEMIIDQFYIDPYKIDLYFPKYKLAIECDEYFHCFQKEDDIKREEYIKEKLNCTFIRYKQDKNNKNLSKLIYEINQFIYN